MPDTLSVIFSLIGVIAVIVIMFWAARWFQKKYGYGFNRAGKSIRIDEVVSLSPDTRLVVATVDGRRFLIGSGNVRLLSELGETAEEPVVEIQTEKKTMPIGEAFRTVLAEKLGGSKLVNEEKENVGEDS